MTEGKQLNIILFADGAVAEAIDHCTCSPHYGAHEPTCGLEFIGFIETDERSSKHREIGWDACKKAAMRDHGACGDISAQMRVSRLVNPYRKGDDA
jgi:hypothetical protein